MLRAIILDFDGVVADTEPLHFQGFKTILAEEGIPLTKKAYYEKYLGFDDHDCFLAVFKDHHRRLTARRLKQLIRRKTRHMKELFRRRRVLLPGAKRAIKLMAARHPLAIVSGALRGEIELILKREELSSFIAVLVAADDVKHGKPHPEGLRKALRHFNEKVYDPQWPLRPRECLVIEDSLWGIEAARRAGMPCLAVSTSYPRSKLKSADTVWSGLKDVKRASLPKLEQLFAS